MCWNVRMVRRKSQSRGLCSPEAFFGAYFCFGRVFHGLWYGFAVIAPSAQNLTCMLSSVHIFRLGVFFMAYGMVLPLSPPPHKTSLEINLLKLIVAIIYRAKVE